MIEQPEFTSKEKSQNRPTEEIFKQKIEHLRKIKDRGFPHQVEEVLIELEDLSQGKGKVPEDGFLYEIREKYYQGWEDEDFKKLVEKVKEELNLE